MDVDLYRKYVDDALSRYAIDELIAIWRESIYLGSAGAVTRVLLKSYACEIARHHDIQLKSVSFKDLVHGYYKKRYLHDSQGLHLMNKIKPAVAYCDKIYLDFAIKKISKELRKNIQEDDRIGAICNVISEYMVTEATKRSMWSVRQRSTRTQAISTNDVDFIDYTLKKVEPNYLNKVLSSALETAISQNRTETVNYLVKKGVVIQDMYMETAAINNNLSVLQLLMDNGCTAWFSGLCGAKKGGHKELRKFFSCKIVGRDASLPDK